MKFAISVGVLFTLSATTAFASNITTAASAPASNVAISQTTIGLDPDSPFEAIRKTANNANNWRVLGQTFTVESAFTLDKISLKVSQYDQLPTIGLSLYVDVWNATSISSTSGTSLAGFPDTGITTSSFVVHPTNPAPESARVWMTFDIANVALTPGIYGFKIGFNTPDFSGNYQLGSSSLDIGGAYISRGGDPYAGGQMFRYHPFNGTLAASFTDGLSDLAFIIQSAPPVGHAGDFDGDGDVDGADFVAWQTNFPKASGAVLSDGDADMDGDVDGADFVVWQTNFPYTPGPGISSIPEPTSLCLSSAALAVLGFIAIRTRATR